MTKAKLKLYIYCKYRIMCGRGDECDGETVKEVENFIYTVPNIITRQILTERYIYGKTWASVAASVGSSEDSCRKTADRFVKQLQNGKR